MAKQIHWRQGNLSALEALVTLNSVCFVPIWGFGDLMLLLRSSARSGDSDSPRGILNSAAMLALSPIFKIEISPARWVCLLCLVCLF